MGRRPRYDAELDGVLVVDKPMGVSSSAVVQAVRWSAGNCKTGHAGTLDPLATGVLVCCLGKATKAVAVLMSGAKTYEAVVDLSAFTATDDREGEREDVVVSELPGLADVEAACAGLVGEIEQRPPAYSAVHVGGRRAYAMARAGEAVEVPSRVVRVDGIGVLGYAWPEVRLRVDCGKGVYIRSLARDLGVALGTGGHLASLRRTRVGRFGLEGAWTLERVKAEGVRQADLVGVEARS